MASLAGIRMHVSGQVQGVGFRPFTCALAADLGLAGQVGNDGDGVFIEAEGGPAALAEFVHRIQRDHPPLAQLDQVTVSTMDPTGAVQFTIAHSRCAARRRVLAPPDTAPCDDCLAELADPGDRRYGHPFVNCTNCGPRFTIVTGLPYDRARTTMAGFPMCAACRREYRDPTDRRFHAQPVCCPACGPTLVLTGPDGTALSGPERAAPVPDDPPLPADPVAAAAVLLRAGRVLAVKGLGGYHLAVDATNPPAVATLRARKHRASKPFAVMVADLATARRLCTVREPEARLLTSPARPIVLLPRLTGATADRTSADPDRWQIARGVAPGDRLLGLVLPYTPLHQLLLAAVGRPLVMTSGNLSDEPIVYEDREAYSRLRTVADAYLTHDRPIHTRADDSVARSFRGQPLLLRRSRGYVPQPVALPWRFLRPVLACGAELKNTICLGSGSRAVCSPHIGDLEDHRTLRAYTDQIDRLTRLCGTEPRLVAHDLHPEYLSTKYARDLTGVDLVGVQHHHAHIAACLADNGEAGPVIGVAFDGTGYGADGTLWGGEILVADLAGYQRAGHLAQMPMPGGSTAIRQPWRMAVAYLDAAFDGDPPTSLDLLRRHGPAAEPVRALARSPIAPVTSSAGRLCDAVGAILGLGDRADYEGQVAIALEQLADPRERAGYRFTVHDTALVRICPRQALRQLVDELRLGVPRPLIAARFHHGLADAVVATSRILRERTGLATVALSGGVFQNLLLLARVTDGLAQAGFRVLTHSQVPPNDGGISLGQAVVAGACDRQGLNQPYHGDLR